MLIDDDWTDLSKQTYLRLMSYLWAYTLITIVSRVIVISAVSLPPPQQSIYSASSSSSIAHRRRQKTNNQRALTMAHVETEAPILASSSSSLRSWATSKRMNQRARPTSVATMNSSIETEENCIGSKHLHNLHSPSFVVKENLLKAAAEQDDSKDETKLPPEDEMLPEKDSTFDNTEKGDLVEESVVFIPPIGRLGSKGHELIRNQLDSFKKPSTNSRALRRRSMLPQR